MRLLLMSLYLIFRSRTVLLLLLILLAVSTLCAAQETPTQTPQPSSNQVAPVQAAPDTSSPVQKTGNTGLSSSDTPVNLLIGPGDQGDMSVYGVPELTAHFRVGASGEVGLPLIGSLKIGGLTAEQAEEVITKKYVAGGFLRSPHVTVMIREYTTQGVSVMGEVARPGVYSALAARRLYDLFLAAGGLSQRAGRNVTIQHADKRPTELITLGSDLMATPETNVEIKPGDTVIVPRAGVVYVIGEVNRPGEYVISAGTNMTALSVMAMAAGPSRYASLGKTRLMRKTPQGIQTSEIDLKKIMDAKNKDVALNSEDILFIPASKGKMAAERGASSVLSMLTSLAVYRF